MKQTLTKYEIADSLLADQYANWSHAGACALAEYLDENMPEDAEFCCVDIRGDWAEYKSLENFREDYFSSDKEAREAICADDDEDDDERLDSLTETYIRDNGEFIEFDGGLITSII